MSTTHAGSAVDYRGLNLDNIPSIQTLVKSVLQASSSGQFDLKKQTVLSRISTLAPSLRVQWGETARNHNLYGVRELESHRRYYDYPGPTALEARDYDTISRSYGVTGVEEKSYASWHVLMRWKLNNLLVNRDEIYLREMRSRSLNYQGNTIDNAVRIYTTLAELLLEKADIGEGDPSLERDITLAAAELDFLSGGLLAKTLKESAPLSSPGPEGSVLPGTTEEQARPAERSQPAPAPEAPAEEAALDPQIDPNSPLYELGGDDASDFQDDFLENEFENDPDQ